MQISADGYTGPGLVSPFPSLSLMSYFLPCSSTKTQRIIQPIRKHWGLDLGTEQRRHEPDRRRSFANDDNLAALQRCHFTVPKRPPGSSPSYSPIFSDRSCCGGAARLCCSTRSPGWRGLDGAVDPLTPPDCPNFSTHVIGIHKRHSSSPRTEFSLQLLRDCNDA